MTDHADLEEAVFLFADDLSSIASEMHYQEFEALLNRSAAIEQFAASRVRAAYVVVGEGLAVRAIVFFTFRVDEEGQVDDRFNVPLRYLARQAGKGPDLGHGGPIRLACRSHCPIPWQANNLWEPEGVGDVHPAIRLQKAVTRNRLGLKPRRLVLPDEDNPVALQQALEERLSQTLDNRGRINVQALIASHNEQLQQVAAQFRRELAQQQQAHGEQLRGAREEVQKLRQALRSEKARNRRLQELLRGDA
ncbi:MAG: hypothetical protein AAGG11_05950 [Pseudomonadota bacterium]